MLVRDPWLTRRLAAGVGVGVGLAVGRGVTVGLAVGRGVAVGLAVGRGVGLVVAVGPGVVVGRAAAVGVGDALGRTVGLVVALVDAPEVGCRVALPSVGATVGAGVEAPGPGVPGTVPVGENDAIAVDDPAVGAGALAAGPAQAARSTTRPMVSQVEWPRPIAR